MKYLMMLIPALCFSQANENQIFSNELIRYVLIKKDDAFQHMNESKTTSIYLYYRGQYDAYIDVLDRYESMVN